MNIEDLYNLDMAGDAFGAILWVWSLCPTPEFRPLETIAFPTAASGLNLDDVETIETGSGRSYASRRVQATFRHDWDMDHYPFDRQRVAIQIDEDSYGASRLVFEPNIEQSFLTPDIRTRLDQWRVSDLMLTAGVSDEPSTYGLPDVQGSQYAFIRAVVMLERTHVVTFMKLSAGVFAAVFIAFLTFSPHWTDPRILHQRRGWHVHANPCAANCWLTARMGRSSRSAAPSRAAARDYLLQRQRSCSVGIGRPGGEKRYVFDYFCR